MKCPNCGAMGSLVYQELHQAAYERRVLRNGKLSKKRKYVRIGPLDYSLLFCTQCTSCWWTGTSENDDFDIEDKKVIFLVDSEVTQCRN